MDTTTIEVSRENWQWLNSLKEAPGESFNDVIDRLRDAPATPTTPDPGDAVADLELPGSGDTLQSRRAAVAQLYRHLQDEGTATKREFLDLVEPSAVGYQSAESFWSNCIKGRDSLAALPGVQPPGEGEHTWRYTASSLEEQ